MSNLPHPLGDSNPGDLFYPGAPNVIVADAPGVAGSRAVEFGEDGLSSVVNRMGYALGKNEEYIQERMETQIARPDLVTFTPAGGNGGSYTFSAVVWCGDIFYLPEDQSVRNGLMTVLDELYNDLVDPVSGDVIVVKEILDAPAGSSQVGAGFITDPYITFRKMNPVTGALGGDYTIPNGTKVWLAFGRSATLDALVTETNTKDAWFRGFTRSIGEIHAASFLKDGSRKATDAFDMDGNNLENVGSVVGVSTADLTLSAIGGGANLRLYADDEVSFIDQYLGGYLSMNSGATALAGSHTSVLTSLNSKTEVAGAYFGNRCLSRTGSLTFTDGTGQVDWPELSVVIDGDQKTIAASNLIATSNPAVVFVLVVTSAGTVVERSPHTLVPSDIPLAAYTWTGAAFTKKVDIRWAYNGTSRHIELTCGDAECDFASTELDQAVELTCRLGYAAGHMPVLRIVGTANAPSASPYNITLTAPITILGCGIDKSTIKSDDTNGDTVDLFDCNGHKIVVKDLTVMHAGDEQAATLGAFKDAGDDSIFQNLLLDKDPGSFDVGFANAFIWTQAEARVLIDKIRATELRHAFIMGSDATFATAYLSESRIRDCSLAWGGSPMYGCVVNGDGNIVENVEFSLGLDDYAIVAGNDTLVDRCRVRMTGAAGATPAAIFYKPISSPSYSNGLKVRDCSFMRVPGAGILADAINDALMIARIDVRGCDFNEVDKPIDLSALVLVHPSSAVFVESSYFYSSSEFIATVDNLPRFHFLNNTCASIDGDGVCVLGGASADIVNNRFNGQGSSGSYNCAIYVSETILGLGVRIRGNSLNAAGIPASSAQIELHRPCEVKDNLLNGENVAEYGIYCPVPVVLAKAINNSITNNTIVNQTFGIYIEGNATWVYNGSRVEGNRFSGQPQDGAAVKIVNAGTVLVTSNLFWGITGIGIHILGNVAGGSCNNHIEGNSFNDVKGEQTSVSSPAAAVVWVSSSLSGACVATKISDNHFANCGSTDVAVLAGDSQAVIHISANAPGYMVQNNLINQIAGCSASANQGDTARGIHCLSQGKIQGNQIYKNFAVAGYVADTIVGIEVGADYCHLMGNYVFFTGTQGDSNKSSVATGIEGGTQVGLVLVGNQVTEWVIAGATLTTISANGNNVVFVGNFGEDAAGWVGGASGVVVGNCWPGANALSWNAGTNKPSATQYDSNTALPYADMNENAIGHG